MQVKIFLIIGLLCFFCTRPGLSQGTPITFSAIGDIPYSTSAEDLLVEQIANHNLYSPAEFLIHLGDIKSGGGSCSESIYQDVAGYLRGLAVPAFIVIGDNEYTDCSDSDEAFAFWETYFKEFEQQFCGAPWVERHAERHEIFAFVQKGVLFMGFNLPGGGPPGDIMDANIEFLQSQMQSKAAQVRAAVIFAQAKPSGIGEFIDAMTAEALTFGKPVMYIHGDGHSWEYEHPYVEDNIWRIQVEKEEDPLEITVSMDPNDPFPYIRNPWDNNPVELNVPPCVEAGADTVIDPDVPFTLTGRASDDGVPSAVGNLTITWSKLSGPGSVTFGDPGDDTTAVTFSTQGTYTLRLTANDGELEQFDDIVITYGEPLPLLSIGDAAVTEGDAGTVPAIFTVQLSAASSDSVMVEYTTTESTALEGSDYAPAADTLIFLPGSVSEVINITVFGDLEVEGDEQFQVKLFHPVNAQLDDSTATGTILTDDYPSLPVLVATPDSFDFGEVALNLSQSRGFALENLGGLALELSDISLIGPDLADFVILGGDTANTLATREVQTVVVAFQPQSAGIKRDTLQITSNDPAANPRKIPLSGIGVILPQDIVVSPLSHEYGNVLTGTPAAGLFEIVNAGGDILQVDSVVFAGIDAGDFSAENVTPLSLAPGDTATIALSFQPELPGPKSATASIYSNDPDENPLTIALSGTGVTPDIATSITGFNFGQVLVGQAAQTTLEVQNVGSGDLEIVSLQFTGAGGASFAFSGIVPPATISPGQQQSLTVTFQANATGAVSADLEIYSNDPDENPLVLGFSASVVNELSNIVLEAVVSGSSVDADTVTSASLAPAGSEGFYIAAITSTKDYTGTQSVSGLGLTWSELRTQCSGRNRTGVDIWTARGTPTAGGTVLATLPDVPSAAVITVTRYAGVSAASPIDTVLSGNTHGENGACLDGTDGAAYSFPVFAGTSGMVIYSAVSMRDEVHTPGAGFTEQSQVTVGSGSSAAGQAVADQVITSGGTYTISGTFDADADWALVGLVLMPQGSATSTTHAVEIQAGWNLVSLPNLPENRHYQSIFPNAATGSLFAFNQNYLAAESLAAGAGYWLQIDQADTVSISGLPLSSQTVDLAPGWNILGSISSGISLADIDDPDGIIEAGSLFGFDLAYFSADSILPGRGYWVMAQSAGQINLQKGGATLARRLPKRPDITGFPHLQITDAGGRITQTLYFAVDLPPEQRHHRFPLPPMAPGARFDARFRGGTRAILGSEGHIEVHATRYPLTIRPQYLPAGPRVQYVLSEMIGQREIARHLLANHQPVVIENPGVKNFRLFQINPTAPSDFALEQNYPNPFNPGTTIRYALAQPDQVEIVIYDILGQTVKTLLSERQEPGLYEIHWDGTGQDQHPVSSGTYFYQVTTGKKTLTKKMILLR